MVAGGFCLKRSPVAPSRGSTDTRHLAKVQPGQRDALKMYAKWKRNAFDCTKTFSRLYRRKDSLVRVPNNYELYPRYFRDLRFEITLFAFDRLISCHLIKLRYKIYITKCNVVNTVVPTLVNNPSKYPQSLDV